MQRKAKPQKPKAVPLTQARLKTLLSYDPETGIFKWKVKRPHVAPGDRAGSVVDPGYRLIAVDGTNYKAARLAYFYMTGKWPPAKRVMDHKNGQKGDDRWCNLRTATYQQNAFNKGPGKRNKSGVVGVCQEKPNKWSAYIFQRRIGYFDEKADAIAARREAEKEHFGEFARNASLEAEGVRDAA